MLKFISKIINFFLNITDIGYKYSKLSYSQEGEDLVLRNILRDKKKGFYIDIGAHHPFRFSNTYSFYKTGWKGINIDPMPGSMALFNKYRKEDINIEMGVADKKGSLTYYLFNDSALNGFDKPLSLVRSESTNYKVIDTVKIRVDTLNNILVNYLPKEVTDIDFISVDVEGYEARVLKDFNFKKYHPKVMVVESLTTLESVVANFLYTLLVKNHYKLIGCTGRSYFFKYTK